MTEADTKEAIRCAGYLKALADPNRLRIVQALRMGPLSVSDVALALESELALVSHHLRVLFNAGLVTTEREGKFIYYSLSSELTQLHGSGPSLDFGCCRIDIRPPASEPS